MHHTGFRNATITVYANVISAHNPWAMVPLGDDHVPVMTTDTHVSVSLHHLPVHPTDPELHEFTHSGYRRLWIPRTPDVWLVRGSTAQMKRMWDFPPQSHYDTLRIPAYALWMGDAIISTGVMPANITLGRGDILQIAFLIAFDSFGKPSTFIRH